MSTASNSQRHDPIDFAKGGLVVLMILYHWLNYFVTPAGDFYRYLRFITPSFTFITGYLISGVLAPKYGIDNRRLHRRLLERGGKLLVLFTLLNFIAHCFMSGSGSDFASRIVSFFHKTFSLYIGGSGKPAIFHVLAPISYLLILSPLLLKASVYLKCPLLVSGLGPFSLILALAFLDMTTGPLELLGLGFLGFIIGGGPPISAVPFPCPPTQYLVILLYLAQLVCVTIWNVVFWVQAIAVCAHILLLYWIGTKCPRNNIGYRIITILGQYTLFAYIFHIVILQFFRHTPPISLYGKEHAVLPLLLTFLLTLFAVRALDYLRPRSVQVDRFYRFVFA